MSTTPAPPHHSVEAQRRAVLALTRERDRLERVVAELADLDRGSEEEDLGEIASTSQHPADVGSETFEREVEFGLLDEFRDSLAEVDAAMMRVEQGRYGVCERCLEPIDGERLEAVPATRFCLPCAELAERDARWRTAGPRPSAGPLGHGEFLADDDEPADVELSAEESAVTSRDPSEPG